MKKTRVDLQKRFPTYHAYPKCLAAYLCGSASRQDREWVEIMPVWDCPLRTESASWKSLASFRQLTSFCNSWTLAVNSWIVSWIEINIILENSSNLDPWNRSNSSILMKTSHMSFTKIPILFWQMIMKKKLISSKLFNMQEHDQFLFAEIR